MAFISRGYQLVATSIWNDSRFTALHSDAQLAWFFLFTHPLCKQLGIYKASLSGLYDELNVNGCWTRDRFDNAVLLLETEGLIIIDRKNLLVAFPRFFSESNPQNLPQNKNQAIYILKAFTQLPNSPVVMRCFINCLEMMKQLGKRLGKQFTKQLGELLGKPFGEQLCIDIVFNILKESDGGGAAKREKRPWPDDLVLTEELLSLAAELGIDAKREFEKAKNHCKASGKEYIDYIAFLRKWFHTSVELNKLNNVRTVSKAATTCQERVMRGNFLRPCGAASITMVSGRALCKEHKEYHERRAQASSPTA